MRRGVSEIMVVTPWGGQVVAQTREGDAGFISRQDEFEVLLGHPDGHVIQAV